MATPAFEEIAETFEFLDDWEDRYRHVIDMGKAMPPLDDSFKVPALIVVAALLSAVTATPTLALASGVAFLVAEVVDWAVFTPLRGRSLPLAVVASSVVAAPVDTVLFLALAGFPVTVQAVAGQFLVKTGLALLVAAWLRWRR